mmetsp:Transcript_27384/g.57137  ORF Transcript_27384/g.57137 Transcript_27384/m.57137 type:complete len:81 (+) Transcript_27384:127-369(+)
MTIMESPLPSAPVAEGIVGRSDQSAPSGAATDLVAKGDESSPTPATDGKESKTTRGERSEDCCDFCCKLCCSAFLGWLDS